MPKIYITMLGEFTIGYRGKVISQNDKRGKKMLTLLQYLIAHREREVSQSELIEQIWPDSENPANALKTLIHRTRDALTEVLPEGTELILSNHGSYRINPEAECFIDSGEFAKLCNMADNESLSRTKRVHLYKKAFSLYKGGYLSSSSYETWVLPINVYFHTLYFAAVDKCVRLLYPMGKFSDIIMICEKAMIISPMDEKIHEHLIRAMVAIGEYGAAANQYEYIKRLLLEQYGTPPSPRLTELYELTVKPRSDTQKNLEVVLGELSEDKLSEGGYFCEYEVFKYIFRLYKRESIRLKTKLSMCLVTLEGKNGEELTHNKLLTKEMQKLGDCIGVSLRMRDVFTKYSRAQYILLLPGADGSSSAGIKSRIMSKFQRYQEKMEICAQFDFKDLSGDK